MGNEFSLEKRARTESVLFMTGRNGEGVALSITLYLYVGALTLALVGPGFLECPRVGVSSAVSRPDFSSPSVLVRCHVLSS
jgi:hypothetical protein